MSDLDPSVQQRGGVIAGWLSSVFDAASHGQHVREMSCRPVMHTETPLMPAFVLLSTWKVLTLVPLCMLLLTACSCGYYRARAVIPSEHSAIASLLDYMLILH